MRTEYTKENGEFSNRAHKAAQHLVYPEIFKLPFERLEFESTLLESGERERLLDGEMAVDRIVKVTAPDAIGFHLPLTFTVQERFRRLNYGKTYTDLTITEWNNSSSLPSELYKIKAGIFLYGYYGKVETNGTSYVGFGDAIAVSVMPMLIGLANGTLPFCHPTNKKNQDFLGIEFMDLWEAGYVLYWKKAPPRATVRGEGADPMHRSHGASWEGCS